MEVRAHGGRKSDSARVASMETQIRVLPVAAAILMPRVTHNRTTATANHSKNQRVKLFSISSLL